MAENADDLWKANHSSVGMGICCAVHNFTPKVEVDRRLRQQSLLLALEARLSPLLTIRRKCSFW